MEDKNIARPAVLLGFSYFSTLLIATFAGVTYTPVLSLSALLALCFCFLLKLHRTNKSFVLTVCAIFLGFLVFTVLNWTTVRPVERYVGNTYRVHMKICSDAERNYGNFYYTAHVFEIEEPQQSVDLKVRLSHGEALPASVDDTLICTVRFSEFEDSYGLSSRTSQLADGKVLSAYISNYEDMQVVPAESHSFAYYQNAVQTFVKEKILNYFPKTEASILSAMLLGDRSDLPATLLNDYKSAGAVHILVVSGMHMAIIAQFALSALCFLGLRRRAASLITIFFVVSFMVLSGMSATVVRSGIMQIILLLGIAIGRKADALNSLAIAIAVLALTNPFCVGDISLLLSFSATFGIIQLSPQILRLLTGRIQKAGHQRFAVHLLSPIATSVAAILGALPVQLYVFGTVQLTSLLSSILILYASAWLLRFGILAVMLLCVPVLSPMAAPFIFCSNLLIRYQNAVVTWIADTIPLSLEFCGAYLQIAVLLSVLLFAIGFLVSKNTKLRAIACALSILIFCTGMAANAWKNGNEVKILVLHSDFAVCTAVVQNNEACVLQCSGNQNEVAEFLKANGVTTLRQLYVSEPESAVRCASSLSDIFPTARIYVPDTVYFSSDTNVQSYHYAMRETLFTEMPFTITANGALEHLTVYGKTVAFEEKDGSYQPENADILVTKNTSSKIRAPFTVLRTDAIIEDIAETLYSGDYILTSSYEKICLCFSEDGNYTVLGG